MKRLQLKLAGLVLAAFALPTLAFAQVTATIHGKVTNAAGAPLIKGDVKLTTEKTVDAKDRKYVYTFPIDQNGMFKGEKISPGDYIAVVFVQEAGDPAPKSVDYQDLTLKAGDDKTADFDMTRAAYLKGLSPAELAAIEENKKHNASVIAENAKIGNINATLTKARADEKAGHAAEAVTALKPLIDARPNESILWAALGEAQLNAADDATKAAKAAKTSPTDPAILQYYTDSVASYQKAIDLDSQSKKPSPETVSSCYMNMGQGLAKTGKLKEAADAYEAAVKANPASAPMAYFNEAASLSNAGKDAEAAVAADKAIQADPKRAINYWIKGKSLVVGASLDPKTNKYVLPPGCLEAYQQYLELDPTGPHAQEVKDLLNGLNQPLKSSFKAGKK